MKLFFGSLFLLITIAVFAVLANLLLGSIGDEDCRDIIIKPGHATLLVFLIIGSSLLSHLPEKKLEFKRLSVLWGLVFLGLAIAFLSIQFFVFQDYYCEDKIHGWVRFLAIVLTVGLFFASTVHIDGVFQGSVFLILSIAIISSLVLSLIEKGVEYSGFGYFCFIVYLILLGGAGAGMVNDSDKE